MTDVTKPDRKAWRVQRSERTIDQLEATLNDLTQAGYTVRDILPVEPNVPFTSPHYLVVAFDPAMIMSNAVNMDLDKLLGSLGGIGGGNAAGTPQAPATP